MAFFESFGSLWDSITGSNQSSGQTVQGVSGTIVIPSTKPTYIPPEMRTTDTGFFGTLGGFLKDATAVVSQGASSFFDAKSKIEQAKTALKIEEIKLKAVTQSAQNAPAPAQVLLPTFSDFIADPRTALSNMTPSVLLGSGLASTGLNLALIGVVAVGAIFLLRK